jgi:hypothetical protein
VIAKIDGEPVGTSAFRDDLLAAGFVAGYRGYALRPAPPTPSERGYARPSPVRATR